MATFGYTMIVPYYSVIGGSTEFWFLVFTVLTIVIIYYDKSRPDQSGRLFLEDLMK